MIFETISHRQTNNKGANNVYFYFSNCTINQYVFNVSGFCLNDNSRLRERKMYTAQINAFGNVIVCKGDVVRKSYQIIYTGTYQDCLKIKLDKQN